MNNDRMVNYTSGMLSGMMTAGIYHPIDSLRIRSFLNPTEMGSLKSLKNGLAFNIGSTGIKNVVLFPLREQIRDYEIGSGNLPSIRSEITTSLIVGNIMSLIGTPINVIKIRMQNNIGETSSFINISKDIYIRNGPSVFFRGYFPTTVRDVFWNVAYFSIFDSVSKNKNISNEIVDTRIVGSIVGAIAATSVSYPFDGMRLFCQKPDRKDEFHFLMGFKKSFECSRANVRSYFYAIIRIPLATCTSHMSYLYFKDFLSKRKD